MYAPSSFHVVLIHARYRNGNTSRVRNVVSSDDLLAQTYLNKCTVNGIAHYCYWRLEYVWEEAVDKMKTRTHLYLFVSSAFTRCWGLATLAPRYARPSLN